MWLSPYSNGSKPRWGFEEQILTREQSSQGLVAGEQLGFTDVMYEPNMEELEVYKLNLTFQIYLKNRNISLTLITSRSKNASNRRM